MPDQACDQPIDKMRKMPQQARARRTIATILEAAAQILEKDGEKGLTTNRIAERAGFSIGTLYQYFPGLDAILLAMISVARHKAIAELEQLIDDFVVRGGDPRLAIRAFVRMTIDYFGISSMIYRPLLKRGWLLDHHPQVIADTQMMAQRVREGFVRRAHPDFPPPDPATLFVVTRGVLGAIRAAVLEDSSLVETPDFEDALTALAEAMLVQRDR